MKSYYLFILGCQMNYADADRIRTILNFCGLKETDEKSADLIITLACSVRQKPIQRIWGKIKNWKENNKKIWITGCVLPDDRKKFVKKADRVFRIEEMGEISQWLEKCHSCKNRNIYNQKLSWIPGSSLKMTAPNSQINSENNKNEKKQNYLEIKPTIFKNEFSHHSFPNTQYLLPIMTGCNNFCSYCAVPYCRGREISRSEKNILEEVKQAIKKGHKRILLLGQNVNSYQKPNKKIKNKNDKPELKNLEKNDFINLLKKIDSLKGDFSFNFLSSHPKDVSNDLIKVLSELKKWEKEFHLPIQSGSNKILKKMNRKYSVNKYLKIIYALRKNIKNISITTDVIVGFPTETKKDFQKTLDALKIIKPNKIFVSQYSPRPNTAAWEIKNDVSEKEKKRRWQIINQKYNK